MSAWNYYVQRHEGPVKGRGRWVTVFGPFRRHANARRLMRALERRPGARAFYRVRRYHPNDPRQEPAT